MFASNLLYMCTFIGRTLWVCGFAINANWQQVAQFTGTMPVKAMLGTTWGVVVIDGSGALWDCSLPTGVWVQDIPQPPFAFREFMGFGFDDNRQDYIAALDTAGQAWLIGKPGAGGQWVQLPNLTPP